MVSFFLMLSCDGEGEGGNTPTRGNETELNLITGMYARASDFDTPILLGNPNVLNTQAIVFPNPAIGNVVVKSNSNPISSIWLVKGSAQKRFQNIDFSNSLTSDLYSESEISSNSEIEISDLNSTNLSINLENLSFGYYRVFMKMSDEIFWTNIYVGNDLDINQLEAFWN